MPAANRPDDLPDDDRDLCCDWTEAAASMAWTIGHDIDAALRFIKEAVRRRTRDRNAVMIPVDFLAARELFVEARGVQRYLRAQEAIDLTTPTATPSPRQTSADHGAGATQMLDNPTNTNSTSAAFEHTQFTAAAVGLHDNIAPTRGRDIHRLIEATAARQAVGVSRNGERGSRAHHVYQQHRLRHSAPG